VEGDQGIINDDTLPTAYDQFSCWSEGDGGGGVFPNLISSLGPLVMMCDDTDLQLCPFMSAVTMETQVGSNRLKGKCDMPTQHEVARNIRKFRELC
jgi:hypothetical protein